MVRLDKITTKTGDKGTTRLADGTKVAKDSAIMHAIGTIDECNCMLGLVLLETLPDGVAEEIRQIQNDLFDVGSDLVTPPGVSWEERACRISDVYVERLEAWTVAHGDQLEPLNSFTLPGGSRAAAFMHQARVVARRAERLAVAAWPTLPKVDERKNRCPVIYLNRLSDYLFQLCRRCNDNGASDVLWKPGAGAE